MLRKIKKKEDKKKIKLYKYLLLVEPENDNGYYVETDFCSEKENCFVSGNDMSGIDYTILKTEEKEVEIVEWVWAIL